MGKATNIIKKLRIFKENVKIEFPVIKLILFGSRATCNQHKYSDIDLIVVSPKFKKLNYFKRGAKMYNYWDLDYPVDFLCFTPEEFNAKKKQVSIVSEALKKGIEI